MSWQFIDSLQINHNNRAQALERKNMTAKEMAAKHTAFILGLQGMRVPIGKEMFPKQDKAAKLVSEYV